MLQAQKSFGALVFGFILLTGLTACSSSSTGGSTTPTGSLTLSASPSTFTIQANGASVPVTATLARTNTQDAATLAVTGLPAGLTTAIVQPGTGSSATVTFSAAAATAAGTYPLTLTASTATLSASTTVTATALANVSLSLAPAASTLVVSQDGTASVDALSVTHATGNAAPVTISASSLPAGLTAVFSQPGTGSSGTLTLTSTAALAGTSSVVLTATDGTSTVTSTVAVTVAAAVHVYNTTDTSKGLAGAFSEAMSTGFQPSPYDDAFFPGFPTAPAQAAALKPQHMRIQPVGTSQPWLANSSPQLASDWSFTALDKTVQPLLSVGDASPQFQVAVAPVFLSNSSGQFIVNSTNLALLASYAANLVRYYNTGGFTWGGQHFQSASTTHITQWAIFNEPNLNGITAAQYVQIYNALVPAMLAVDSTLQFSTLELSAGYSGQATAYMPTLVQPAASGGLAAQVNVLSTHFYSSCNQTDTDTLVFSTVAEFTSEITYMRNELKLRSDLANLPIWVTENNVNADYQQTNGYSDCHPTQIFVTDPRGSSAFFAAWRPYVFSQLGKAGNQALYHFLFEGSTQYGEVSSTSDATLLSYWVDYWLQRTFPVVAGTTASSILTVGNTQAKPDIEVLATRNADKSVSLLVSDVAIASATDNNGAGVPRTILINVSDLGAFTSATMVQLTATTPITTGPTQTTFSPGTTLSIALPGYGTALIRLIP